MSLYEVLGVPRGAPAGEIKKAYRRMALEHHPDKGGDPEAFKRIQKAYEILSDDRRREMYDRTGSEEEMDGGGGGAGAGGMPFPFPGGGIPFDIGSMFGGMFGGGRGGGAGAVRPKTAKGPVKVHEMPVSLWDFYHGKTVRIAFDRHKFCGSCKGEGVGAWKACGGCGGSGQRAQIVMMGPMQAMMHGPCGECRGEGRLMESACWTCNGKKFMTEQKILEVVIRPDMLPGETIIFPGACSDQEDCLEAGDVHIILAQADEDGRIVRKGRSYDLATELECNLLDSLLGRKMTVMGHPGTAALEVEIPPGTQHGEVVRISGQGMPAAAGARGDLYITVKVAVAAAEKEVLRQRGADIRALFSACEEQTPQGPQPASTQDSCPSAHEPPVQG